MNILIYSTETFIFIRTGTFDYEFSLIWKSLSIRIKTRKINKIKKF